MELFEIAIDKLPQALLDQADEKVIKYTVGLMAVSKINDNDFKHIGSGVLVECDTIFGIVTAAHVADRLRNTNLGLVLVERIHKLIIQNEYLDVVRYRTINDEDGPDIAFIKLPRKDVGTIAAIKSFYSLSIGRQRFEDTSITNDLGFWIVTGFPEQFCITDDKPTAGYDMAKGLGMLRLVMFNPEWQSLDDGFDAYKFSVDSTGRGGAPTDFGGVSGGGLWQVLLRTNNEDQLVLNEILFSGVAFYQGEIISQRRIILFNGKSTLFNKIYKSINSKWC